MPASPRVLHHKIPPDGASLRSENSSDLEGSSSQRRCDGEGSSDKNSPPTSVVLGGQTDKECWLRSGGVEGEGGKNVPYAVLLQELNQAKKQLQELYNLVSV